MEEILGVKILRRISTHEMLERLGTYVGQPKLKMCEKVPYKLPVSYLISKYNFE